MTVRPDRRWLLVVLALAGCRHEPEPAARSEDLFQEAAARTGLKFHHFTGSTGERYMPEIMGAGVALLDYDNDGDLDVYLVQGAAFDPSRQPGEPLGNRLYRNDLSSTGSLGFTDVTVESGTGHSGYGMGVATGDYDNDGDVDLYVTNFGPNVLYRNDGRGRFTDVTRLAGVDDDRWSTSAAFVDYDRDGALDLFVLNYVDFTVTGNKRCYAPTGELDYCTPKAYNPVTARLFRNEGGGRFLDVSVASGISAARGPGLGVTSADLNGDGWVDLYVANDTAANLLWINQKNGTFRENGLPAGAAYSEDGLAKAGMGVSAGDYDNDGWEDLVVVNLTREGATLFRNDASGGFQDVTLATGLKPITYPFTGFGVDWFDYDHDGWLDLFIANGAVTIQESLRGQPYPFHQKNQLIRNEAGKRFTDVSARAGTALALSEVTRGAAFGDIDNDGDVDIVLTNNNGPARLLLNQAAGGGHWLVVRLAGGVSQGARVAVLRRGARPLWRRAHTDSSYLSASDPRVHFGLGDATLVDRIRVQWPDGLVEEFGGVEADRVITVGRGKGRKTGTGL